MVCPFGAAKPGRIYAIKCDMCSDRKGLSYACVEGCPSGALFVASEEEFAKILKENREVSPARSGS
jgi:Fe-S-cluster-containing hydrogenase component 2